MEKEKEEKEDRPRFYYSVIPDALQDDKAVSLHAKYFWSVVYRWSKNKTSEHPSTQRSLDFFAEQTGFDKRTIQRWKKELNDRGWLQERKRYNNSSVIILNKIREESSKNETTRGSHDIDVISNVVPLDELLPIQP